MSIARKINLLPDEEIIAIYYRHQVINFAHYFLGSALILASAFFSFWLLAQGQWGMVLIALGVFLGILVIFRAWFFHRHNWLALTNKRLVDVSRMGWFNEEIFHLNHDEVRDVIVQHRGILPNIFNYGLLIIESINGHTNIEAHNIPRPEMILTEIKQVVSDYKNSKTSKMKAGQDFDAILRAVEDLSFDDLETLRVFVEEELQQKEEPVLESD